jgi:DNA-directed RNA polymerase subunit RPC12/RpoP
MTDYKCLRCGKIVPTLNWQYLCPECQKDSGDTMEDKEAVRNLMNIFGMGGTNEDNT